MSSEGPFPPKWCTSDTSTPTSDTSTPTVAVGAVIVSVWPMA